MSDLSANKTNNELHIIRDYLGGFEYLNDYLIDVNSINTIELRDDHVLIAQSDQEIIKIDHFYKNEHALYVAIKDATGQQYIIESSLTSTLNQSNQFSLYQLQDFPESLNLKDATVPMDLDDAQVITALEQQTTPSTLNIETNTIGKRSLTTSSIDIVAPIIQFEYADNKITIHSNENVKIEILDSANNRIGFATAQADETVVLALEFKYSSEFIQIIATDNAYNETVHYYQLADLIPPLLQDYYVSANGELVLIFDEKIDQLNNINYSLFNTLIDGKSVEIEDIVVNGVSVNLKLKEPVYMGQSVNLIYTDLSAENDLDVLQDESGNDSFHFTIEIENNYSQLQPESTPQPEQIVFYDDVGNGVDSNGLALIETIAHLSVTNDAEPSIQGQGLAGSTILVYADASFVGSTTVNSDGQWSIESPWLADGLHHFYFIQQSPSGVQSPRTDDFSFTVDTRIDSIDSGSHQITAVEGESLIVTNREIDDRILVVKGQLSGLASDDQVAYVDVELLVEHLGQSVMIRLNADAIAEDGFWQAEIPLETLQLVSGQAQVVAHAQIIDQAGNQAMLSTDVQPFEIALTYAQADADEVNFETINTEYELGNVSSTQFLNVLNVSDQLNTQLENGSTISIAPPTDSVSSMGRSLMAPMQYSVNSDVTGKIVLSYQDLSLLSVAKSYGIVLQKLDDNGQWQHHMAAAMNTDGVVASLGTQYALGAIDQNGQRTLTFDGLEAGEYRVSTYIVPSELTQLLTDFELTNLGSEGTLLGQQNQDFLLDAVAKALGQDNPSTIELIKIVEGILKGLNTVTLPISFILDRLVDLPILRDILGVLDKLVDTVVAPLVTNTLELIRNIDFDIRYSETYIKTAPVVGNVLQNDFAGDSDIILTQLSVFDGYQYQTLTAEQNQPTEVKGQYGTLIIHADGLYSYVADASSKDVNAIEFFKYTVRQNNIEQVADFQIKINGNDQFHLSAVNDEQYLNLVVDPTVTHQDLQSVTAGGLAYIGLGSVLDLNTIQIEQVMQINVEHDTQRQIQLKAESGGVQVLTDFDLFIYKWNAEFQQYELYQQHQDWFGVALLGGVSDELSVTLDAGQYIAMIEPNRGINALYGYTLKTTQDLLLDYREPLAVYGKASGNVIHDINHQIGSKDYSPNLDKLYLTALNGQTIFQDQLNTGLTVEGQYGTLEIFANGDYTYTAYDEKRFNYGDQETFIYSVYDPILDQTQHAELTITLDLIHFDPDMDTVNVNLHIDPSATYYNNLAVDNTVTSGKKSTTGFGVVGIGLGDVLSADIISTKPGLNIHVSQGELVSMQFSATGTSVVGLGNVSDLVIYKKNASTGDYELYHSSESFLIVPIALLGIPLGGIYNTPEQVMFSEGEYVAYLTTNGVSVIGGNTLTADHMTVYDYNQVDQYSGVIEAEIDLADDKIISSVNDQAIGQESLQIQGQYGVLTVKSDGQYHYEVDHTMTPPQYGKVDTFSYVKTNSVTGESEVAILNIKLATLDAHADLTNEQGELLHVSASMTNKLDESVAIFDANSALSKSNRVHATALDKFSKKIEFDIQDDGIAKGMKLSFEGLADISSAKIDLSYQLILVKDHQGNTVNQVIRHDVISQTSQAELKLELHDMPVGQYALQLNMPGKAGSLRYYGYDVKIFNQFADQWVQDPDETNPSVKGNLIGNDQLNQDLLAHTILKIKNKTITLDPSLTATEIKVTGQYGVLTVKSDGDYSYQANGQGAGKEIFVYELISPTGDHDKSTLVINVAQHIRGSQSDDTVYSSASNDLYMMSEGSDTVIFDLLDAQDATGGNGVDTWADFDETDRIDLSKLLIANHQASLTDYISVETINGDTVISIDRDAQAFVTQNNEVANQFDQTQLVVLQAKDLTLEQLLQNNQIIF